MTRPVQTAEATVYVVDDDLAVRESLSSLIRSAGMRVEVFDSPRRFLDTAPSDGCSCLILDVRMPEFDGLELQKRLAAEGREIPIIFITGHGDVPLAVRAMKAGALEFLNKPFNDDELLEAIRDALSRSGSACREREELTDLRARFDALTAREREVVFQVIEGKANKCIAIDLGVTESTVKVHRHNIMQKMQVASLPELALAMQRLRKKVAV
jgi:two-component system, LuxR family, response regulator FixJ